MVEQRENARELSKHLGVATIHRGPFVDDLCGFIQFSIFLLLIFRRFQIIALLWFIIIQNWRHEFDL